MKKSTQKDKRKKYKDKLQKRQKLMLNDDSKKNNEEFVEDCSNIDIVVDPDEPIDNPQTGFNYGYIMIPIGIISIVAILKFAKKNTKIYKI